ncbi:MAG: hypothetical protein LBC27_04740 [Spirochaetaceae bacterium]|jgi:hypothetical protein|nr:hypothetical protein [Spirochaetaceae bacterium]
MKKISVFSIVAVMLCAIYANAQELNYTAEEAVQLLESDFSKYAWVHLYYNRKIHDNSSPSTKVARQVYEDGEIVTMQIIYGGWRYEIKLNFIHEKQIFAKRSYDVRKAVYHSIDDMLSQLKK